MIANPVRCQISRDRAEQQGQRVEKDEAEGKDAPDRVQSYEVAATAQVGVEGAAAPCGPGATTHWEPGAAGALGAED